MTIYYYVLNKHVFTISMNKYNNTDLNLSKQACVINAIDFSAITYFHLNLKKLSLKNEKISLKA